MTLEQFADNLGGLSKGYLSGIEKDNRASLTVALRIEELSGGRIDAADLNEDVRAARAACRHGCTDHQNTSFPDGGCRSSIPPVGSEAGAAGGSPSAPVERAA